ncbi:hypothetical protein CEXT_300011 [Caerostris extrusa]|uniref:Uncharacterized protein n=1 Tax=Caerostris extrusa TaxID=172846 RepID=A0AAV4QRC8_CAEEX|nr:hypothetical protein CEXT_300011 [Caerostris extrusa]
MHLAVIFLPLLSTYATLLINYGGLAEVVRNKSDGEYLYQVREYEAPNQKKSQLATSFIIGLHKDSRKVRINFISILCPSPRVCQSTFQNSLKNTKHENNEVIDSSSSVIVLLDGLLWLFLKVDLMDNLTLLKGTSSSKDEENVAPQKSTY